MLKTIIKKGAVLSLILLLASCSNEDTLIENEELSETSKAQLSLQSAKTTNLALGKTAEQSSTAHGGSASRAVDGNTSGVWNTGSVTHTNSSYQPWWQVRLGSDIRIGEIKIWNRTNCCSSRLSNFDVFIYNASGSQVYKTTITGTPSPSVTINAGGALGNRVRVKLRGTNPLSLAEVQVYGSEDDGVSDDDGISDDDNPVTGNVDFDNLQVETSSISGDQGDRDTFDAEDIDNKSWMDVLNSGAVMLKCLEEDGHRTEVKEKPGTEASLNASREMKYTATLTNIPENGVTIAQIHNRGGVKRPWIRVYIDKDKYIKIKSTETTPNKSSSSYDVYVGPKYTSGDELSITVKTGYGNGYFVISTDGNTYNKTLTPSSDWNNYSNDYYLKAGVYTEGDDVQPEMIMTSFSIDH